PGRRTTPRRPIRSSCWSRKGTNSTLRHIRPPLAWKMSAIVPAGWPASGSGGGWKLAARSGRTSGRGWGGAGQNGAPTRLGFLASQGFPGLIHPDELQLGVEPEGRLECVLPKIQGLELARTWMGHEATV